MQRLRTNTTKRTSPARRSTLTVSLFGLCAMLATGCNDDDDDNNQQPPPNTSTAFASTLDRAQTVNNAGLGTLVRVTVKNEAPSLGTFQTPVWYGFHDGTFDLYDSGAAASAALESLAEDGDPAAVQASFDAAAVGAASGTIGGVLGPLDGPIAPGESASVLVRLSAADANARYFSWASMVIPSNDAFIGNDDPLAHEVFDAMGAFVGGTFTILGADVLDAGTETNDEIPMNTFFFGQTVANTGGIEGANIGDHGGFMAPLSGGILDDPMFTGADFENTVGYECLTITLEEVMTIAEPVGTAFLTVDPGTLMATVDFVATNLSGAATLLHLHNGATGVAGPVEVDLFGLIGQNSGGTTTAQGTVAITQAQLTLMRNGGMYFNLHTDLNPSGEVRGQVSANNAATASLTTAAVNAGGAAAPVQGDILRVTAQNRAPELGTFLAPVWIGLHDGTFESFDLAAAASAGLESLAEDADSTTLEAAFTASGNGSIQGVIAGAARELAPGETVTSRFRVNPTVATNRYLSFGTQFLPSNDGFLANDDPMENEIFDGSGMFTGGIDFTVDGVDALDAGTEVNDEIPANTNFFGQTVANTGVVEASTIGLHTGYAAPGMSGVLDDPMFTAADFLNTPGYTFLRVAVGTETVTSPAASGVLTTRVSGSTGTLRMSAVNLSGPVVLAELRNAAATATGPVLVDVTDDVTSLGDGAISIASSFTADATFRTALTAGEVYLVVTTALNPEGELRGQLTPAP